MNGARGAGRQMFAGASLSNEATQALILAIVVTYGFAEDRTWAKVLGGVGVAGLGYRMWRRRQAYLAAEQARQLPAQRPPADPTQQPAGLPTDAPANQGGGLRLVD